jgi:hypothetical protein
MIHKNNIPNDAVDDILYNNNATLGVLDGSIPCIIIVTSADNIIVAANINV